MVQRVTSAAASASATHATPALDAILSAVVMVTVRMVYVPATQAMVAQSVRPLFAQVVVLVAEMVPAISAVSRFPLVVAIKAGLA